jgi:hypothetical protein
LVSLPLHPFGDVVDDVLLVLVESIRVLVNLGTVSRDKEVPAMFFATSW